MAKQKFYNFSGDSDFLKADVLDPYDRKILKLHHQGYFQKEIAQKLNIKDRAMKGHVKRLKKIYEIWNFYQEKAVFIKKMLEKLAKDIDS